MTTAGPRYPSRVDSPELRKIAELVGLAAIPHDRADVALRRWKALKDAGKQTSLIVVFYQSGLLTKTQALVLARADLTERQPFSRYKLLRLVGEGGMALVYEATFLEVKARVALKVLDTKFALLEKFRQRFKREAYILQHLDHENIIEGKEYGSEDGIDYCAMGMADGVSLLDLLEKGVKLSELLSLQVTVQAASALQHMFEKGVVHRDMKPANLVLDHEGTVQIIDFGLAKLMTGMWADTTEETTVGTIEYMSPEQARGRADVDIRSDIYGLGCTLFHMVTGELPFQGTPSQVMFAQVKQEVEFSAIQRARCSAPVQFILRKMMAKEPADRYQTPQALLDDIVSLCGDVLAKDVDVPAEVGEAAVESAPIAPQSLRGPAPGDGSSTKGAIPQRLPPGRARVRRRRT